MALAGRTVVVTRSGEQAGELSVRLRALGAEVVEMPTIAIVDPDDGGAALRDALGDAASFDWIVLTSPNGAERVARASAALGAGLTAPRLRLAVVGPGTAAACRRLGLAVDLVPDRFVAEGLLEVFPAGPGRVLVAQAEAARPVLVDGLRAKRWEVRAVVAYRTVAATVAPELAARAAMADAVMFTSGTTVRGFAAAMADRAMPPVVVCIGPVTADAVRAEGLAVTAVAEPHDLDGLVRAVVDALT